MEKESLIINCINAVNIIETRQNPIIKQFRPKNGLSSNLVQLYESVIDFKKGTNFIGTTDINGEILTSLNESNSFKLVDSYQRMNPDEIVEFRNNNVYAYLNKINESFIDENGLTPLFESVETISKVRTLISTILGVLSTQNDFLTIKNERALSVRAFNKNINVFGYNVFDIIHVNEFKDKKIHYIIYNISNNSILIFCDGIVHTYYIEKDYLIDEVYNYYKAKYFTLQYDNDIKKVQRDLNDFFRSEMSVMYMDYEYFTNDIKDFNNLFNDQKYTKILQEHIEKTAKKDTNVNKLAGFNGGYLLGNNL